MSPSPEPESRDPTYHSTDANYNLPNDTYELTRLEDQAAGLAEMMHNAVIHAPLRNPHLLIDIGCGTGIQTCDFGTAYPDSRVYGIDLSAVPSRDAPKPSNVTYIQGDIRELTDRDPRLEAGSVDYAFSRLLIHGITDWQGYVDDVATLLKPGGWAEMQEYVQDWSLHGEVVSSSWPWLTAIREQAEKKGGDYHCGWNIKGYMEKAGLVDVRQVEYRVPYGTWMMKERPETGRIGRHTAREYGTLYHHGIEKILEGAMYEEREIEEFQAQAKRDLAAEEGKDVPFVVTIGRKPEK